MFLQIWQWKLQMMTASELLLMNYVGRYTDPEKKCLKIAGLMSPFHFGYRYKSSLANSEYPDEMPQDKRGSAVAEWNSA